MRDVVDAAGERIVEVGGRVDVRRDPQPRGVSSPGDLADERRVDAALEPVLRIVPALHELLGIQEKDLDEVRMPGEESGPAALDLGRRRDLVHHVAVEVLLGPAGRK